MSAIDTEHRKLAAIMFTDIQGFTERMGAEDQSGLEVLRLHNKIMDAPPTGSSPTPRSIRTHPPS
jgi:class 3 adenylate cyclase